MLIPTRSFIKWVLGGKANKSTEIPLGSGECHTAVPQTELLVLLHR